MTVGTTGGARPVNVKLIGRGRTEEDAMDAEKREAV